MKKIKILLLLLTFIILPSNVFADSYISCERNESNNYGVNKKWKITSSNINYIKNTPCVDSSKKIYDFSEILTSEEEIELLNRIEELSSKYETEIIILTYSLPYTYDSKNEEFVTDFYDFNDFGLDYSNYNGIVLYRNTYEQDPYYDMFSFGDSQFYLTPGRMYDILNYDDTLYDYIHNGNYLDGFNHWLNTVEDSFDKGLEDGYHLDDSGLLVKDFNPHILLNLGISAVITLIFILINVKKNKMIHKALEASAYFNKESFKETASSDRLVSSHTTSYTESSSSGGSGGGHSSIGHSGGGFSSGGGRHG